MSNLIFNLSGENIDIAKSEVLSLTKTKEYELFDRFLILKTDKIDLEKRLAFTHKIYDLLFISTRNKILKDIEKYDWKKIYKKDFSVRAIDSKEIKEKDLASIIHKKLIGPKVNLINPITQIVFIFTTTNVLVTLFKSEIKKSFDSRKSHMRPSPHPTSLHPRLARALINITGIKEGQILLDPFCGSGGILIEAGLLNLKPVGYDLDEIMLRRAKINLDHYKIENYNLFQKDSTKINKKFDYIVTDLPYGRNSKLSTVKIEKLYLDFLITLKKILKKKAIVIFPNFINYKKLIKKSKLKIIKEFDYYLHKSLSKKIVVLE